ncbi:tetratricopeptide repeat protein [Myxococcaceae bacterium GXIMD 01537]
MRIVCQKCAAAYAIDDRLISPKGVRAQCPRCRNLQLVKREAAPATESPAAPPASAPAPAESSDNSDLFDFGSPPPGLPPFPETPAASPAPAAPPQAAAADPLLDFLGPPPSVPDTSVPATPAAPPAAAAPRRLSSPAVPATPRRPSSPGVAPAPPAAPSAAAAGGVQATSGCRECSKPLTDPFDQALGICDTCRDRAESPLRNSRSSGPQIEQPAPVAPAPSASNSGIRPAAARSSYVAPSMAPRTAARSGSKKGVLIGGVVAVVLLGGGGAAYYFLSQRTAQDTLEEQKSSAPAALPDAVKTVQARWQLKYLDITGTSAELTAQGHEELKKDQRLAYADAEEFFQQALLQDPRNDGAIAGYVLALALGRGASVDQASFQEARALIEAAESRGGRTPELLLAHANLLLSRPRQPQNLELARQLVEPLVGEGTAELMQAEAHLVLGRAFLSTSMGLAQQHFESALKLAPDLRRVRYYRSLALEAAGEYAQALDGLKQRLERDPQHWDSLLAMGRLYQELGEVEQARKLFDGRLKAQPKELRSQLALAALRYETEPSASGAARELQALLKNRSGYGSRDLSEALVRLAIAERLSGNMDAAGKAAEEALKQDKGAEGAHLQLLFLALGRNDAAKAATHLAAVKGNLEDPALEKVLEGRLLMLENKNGEAVTRFQEALKLDERRHDALLLSGVALAKDKRRDEAFRLLFQALESDPTRLSPRPVATLLFMRPSDTLVGAEGIISALADGEEDVVPRLYEGLLRFHQGEWAAAERLLKQVTSVDEENARANAYLALIALQRGNGNAARSLGERAVASGRQMSIAHLAYGLALAEGNKVEPAKKALRDALGLAPKLLAAEVKLAELEAATDKASARARLVKVVGLDPSYQPAKRALFLLDRRG